MQNQEKIIQAIAAYLEENTEHIWHSQGERMAFSEPCEYPVFSEQSFLKARAAEIAAAIAPHLEATPKKCGSCGVNEARLLHACPFREELYNDEETPCDCCFECTGQCKDRV